MDKSFLKLLLARVERIENTLKDVEVHEVEDMYGSNVETYNDGLGMVQNLKWDLQELSDK